MLKLGSVSGITSSFFHLPPARIAELEEENKMSPSNLGIVFGPSLMRPRPTGATISLSSLVDYPHQARIVEMLIVFYSSIFQSKTSQGTKTCSSSSTSIQHVGFPVYYEVLNNMFRQIVSWRQNQVAPALCYCYWASMLLLANPRKAEEIPIQK